MKNTNYTDLIITARPKKKRKIEAKEIVRPLKRATHPDDFVCNMHNVHNGVYDPHVHITIRTKSKDNFTERFNYFLPDWKIDYMQTAQSTLATIYYQSKHTAEYVHARINKPAQCEAFILHNRWRSQQNLMEKPRHSIPSAYPNLKEKNQIDLKSLDRNHQN